MKNQLTRSNSRNTTQQIRHTGIHWAPRKFSKPRATQHAKKFSEEVCKEVRRCSDVTVRMSLFGWCPNECQTTCIAVLTAQNISKRIHGQLILNLLINENYYSSEPYARGGGNHIKRERNEQTNYIIRFRKTNNVSQISCTIYVR